MSVTSRLLLVLCVVPLYVAAITAESYTFKPVYTGGGGGFIVDVVFHPAEKDLIYAKTDMGGAYRWVASTSTWKQLFAWLSADDWNWSGMESLAIDPSDPDKLYVAGGTYTNDWASTNGVIFRSSDRGATFEKTTMPFKMGGNMPGRGMGERLAVDPNLGSIIYFGARNGMGLWKSTDSGVTWSNVTNFPDVGTFSPTSSAGTNSYLTQLIGIPWIVFDKSSGSTGKATPTIYVGVATNAANKNNVYRSTDSGATWSAISGQVTCSGQWSGNVSCTDGRFWTAGTKDAYSGGGIGYLPKNGKVDSEGTLYVTYSDWEGPYNGGHGAVFKYKGGKWTDITPCNSTTNYCTYGSIYFGFGGLAVDPQVTGTVMVSGVNSWWPQGVMFRTTNGGSSWTPAWQYTSYPSTSQVFTMNITSAPWLNFGNSESPPVPAVNIGHMMDNLAIDPFNSNRMMYGTGATLYTTDNLKKWDSGSGVVIHANAAGIEEASVLGLISPPSGGKAHLYSVMGDIGGFRHDSLDTAPSTMYTIPYAGTFNSIDFAELNPTFMVRAGTGTTVSNSYKYGTAWTYSGGDSWYMASADPVQYSGGGTIAAGADAGHVVWALSGGATYYTTGGNSWTASSGIPSGAVVCSDRVNGKKFYGFASGKFYYSTDSGATFTASSASGLPSSGTIKAVFGQEGHVWLAGGLSSGLWYTTDSGVSFTQVTSLAGAAVVGFGKAATGATYPAIYVSGRITTSAVPGLYRSDDAGASWVQISDAANLYNTIQCITGDPQIYGRVYFGTNGLGAVYGDTTGSAASVAVESVVAAVSSEAVPVVTVSSSPADTVESDITPTGSFSSALKSSVAFIFGALLVVCAI